MRKLGINLGSRSNMELSEYLCTVKALGFDNTFSTTKPIEIMYDFANAVAKAGMTYETVHAPFKNINDIWHDGEAGEIALALIASGIDAAKEVGAPVSVIHLSSGTSNLPPTDIGRARFTRLIEYAVSKDITLAFENTRKLANIAWIFEEFADLENVKFCFDCGHESCFTPGREYLPIFGSKLICTHLHDNDGAADEHRLPFDRSIDFERVTRQIRESKYTGSLMLEVSGTDPFYDNYTDIEFLERAASVAKRLRQMVDGE